MEENAKCYMCGEKATTREHVPPLCLFPTQKDIKGVDFRKNLITVPSCEEHNAKKSTDDEFLMVSLAGILGNNMVGFIHSQTKIQRTIRRRSRDFLKKVVMRNLKGIIVETRQGLKVPVWYGNPDYERLKRCFEHIAYGLFNYHTQKVFDGEMRVIPGFIGYNEKNINTIVSILKHKFSNDDDLLLKLEGENPEVFQYQFCKPDKDGLIALRMIFYEGATVYVSFKPKDINLSFDLTQELIKRGVHTTVMIDGKPFIFNDDKA